MQKVLLLTCFFTLFQGVAFSQATLGYHLRKGDVFTVEQQAEQRIVQTLEGTSQALVNRVSGILQFRVLEERDSTYLMEFLFKDLDFRIESDAQGTLLDVHAADSRPTDLQSRVFGALLEFPVRMVLSRKGKILEVTGGDRLVAHLVRQSGLPEGFARTAMQKSLELEYGSQALARSYEQMTYLYPGRAVRVGDQWQNRFEGKLEASNTWQLQALTPDRAGISGMASIAMDVEEPAMSMRLKGTQRSDVTVDRASGFIVEMQVDNRAEGVSTTPQTGSLEIPTVVTSSVTYRLIAQKHVQ